jgi:predicted transcriptional regulator
MANRARRGRRGPGQLESEILAALWAADTPLTPAQVHATVADDLAYNTIHTILSRLHDKGQVYRVVYEGRPAYEPAKDAAGDAADRMLAVLDSGWDRGEILTRFVHTLDEDDEAALRAALRRARRR